MERRMHAIALGKVQGVGLRIATQKEANSLGLRGMVRNLRNGSLEVIAEGEDSELMKLDGFLRNGGGFTEVISMDVDWEKARGDFSDFGIGEDNAELVMGKTKEGWKSVISRAKDDIKELESERDIARDRGDSNRLEELEQRIAKLNGTMIAAKEVLMAPPFNEKVE